MGGVMLIAGGVYAVRARRAWLDKQGMMLDRYALETVDPAVLQELGVQSVAQVRGAEEMREEELFFSDPGARL